MVNIDLHINLDCFGKIYLFTNKINNKKYVGQTIQKDCKRINEHIRNVKNKKNKPLYLAINKYGWENFKIAIIDSANTINELNEKEIYYINKYNSNNKKYGYNLESGGRNGTPNNDTLEKMSNAHKGIVQSEEWINSRIAKKGTIEAKKYGKFKTDEEKKYISENSPKFWLGKKRDDSTKIKISETKKKNGLSEKTKKAICKKVIVFNSITNEIINTYDSTTETAKFYPLSQSTISRRCSGVSKNNGEIHFKYLDNS